jgi:hypothetical protein
MNNGYFSALEGQFADKISSREMSDRQPSYPSA